jgi:hypothetical protein
VPLPEKRFIVGHFLPQAGHFFNIKVATEVKQGVSLCHWRPPSRNPGRYSPNGPLKPGMTNTIKV